MNYRLTISNGENEIDRYYEESFFTDEQGISEAILDMKKTLDEPYKEKNIKEDFWGFKIEEPKKYVVFTWKGLSKDWAEYSKNVIMPTI